jgi:hypothetical protein
MAKRRQQRSPPPFDGIWSSLCGRHYRKLRHVTRRCPDCKQQLLVTLYTDKARRRYYCWYCDVWFKDAPSLRNKRRYRLPYCQGSRKCR